MISVNDFKGFNDNEIIEAAIANDKYIPGGSLNSTHVMHSDWTKRDPHIHNIVIRNVVAKTDLCYTVRLLPAGVSRIWNVVIDGVIDTATDPLSHDATIVMGASEYGSHSKDGLSNITISNVVCNSKNALLVGEYLKDSVISNIINKNPETEALNVPKEDVCENVTVMNLINAKN